MLPGWGTKRIVSGAANPVAVPRTLSASGELDAVAAAEPGHRPGRARRGEADDDRLRERSGGPADGRLTVAGGNRAGGCETAGGAPAAA